MAAAPDHDEGGGEPTPEGSMPGDGRVARLPMKEGVPWDGRQLCVLRMSEAKALPVPQMTLSKPPVF